MQKKGRLIFVGLGIGGERGIPLAGIDALRGCEEIYAETYTNALPEGTLYRLERLCGKKIRVLSREEFENEKTLLSAARQKRVGVVVSGDPLIATTHISLMISAQKQKIGTEVVHASSIVSSAMGESGLQPYKFGKMTTIAYWQEKYKPMSSYEVISENLSRGLHTLLLLDIGENSRPMKPSEAMHILLEMEKEGKKGILSKKLKVVILKAVGWPSQIKAYCELEDLPRFDRGKGPAVLIIPGKLHFLEEEFLSLISLDPKPRRQKSKE